VGEEGEKEAARMNPPDKYSSLTDDVRTSPPPLPTYEYTDIISGIDSLRGRECTTRQRRHTVITHDSRDSKYILSIVIESAFARRELCEERSCLTKTIAFQRILELISYATRIIAAMLQQHL